MQRDRGLAESLGFAGVALLAGVGLVLIAVADGAARSGAMGDVPFWLGILLIAVPAMWRLAGGGASRLDRLGCCLVFGMALFLVKVLHAPVQFAFGDELAHWRTAADIATSGRLFEHNPLSLASPSYPGLEIVTVGVSQVSGLSLYAAALVVGAAARCMIVLALFLLAERLTSSARVAGLATILYAGNPNFAFWSGQFAYESLALPLAILALYLTIRHVRSRDAELPFEAAAIVLVLAVVVTHHITSYLLALLLAAWVVVSMLRHRGREWARAPLAVAVVAALATIGWLALTAGQTLAYIQPVLALALRGLGRVLSGERPVKPLFAGDPELVAPLWERFVAAVAVVLVAVAIVGAVAWLWSSLRREGAGRALRRRPLVVLFALAAVAYVPLPALRLIQGTTEIANRSADFLFVPIGLVIALAASVLARRERFRAIARPVIAAFAVIVFTGGVIIGMPRWARLPGGYLPSGDTRAIQPESQSASQWLLATYGPDRRVVGDLTNTLLLGSYGRQEIVHGLSWVYFRPSFGTLEFDALRAAGVEFLVVDRRLTTALPVGGFYFESGEPEAGRHVAPLDPGQLDRIDAANLERVYDSGDIVIYAIPRTPAP